MTGAKLLGARVGSALITAVLMFACAYDPGPFFAPPTVPEDPTAFRQGHIGLLTTALTKEDQLRVFRMLSGFKISAGGEKGGDVDAGERAQEVWTQARAAIPDPPAPAFIQEYRTDQTAGSFVYYRNCLSAAFDTAAATLADRQQHYASKRAVRDWVKAQDQVFADCSSTKPEYPEPAPAGAAALERADREYQIAAAHFYAEDLQDAERRFRAIAADQSSPWRRVGSYMVGRTLLREVSLQKNEAASPQARQQLESIVKDTGMGDLAASAQGLLQHLDAIEHAESVMQNLSKELVSPRTAPETLAENLRQAAYILRAESFRPAFSKPNLPEAFDWVQSLEKGNSQHPIERWKVGHSLPWLVVALMQTGGKDAGADELIEQADRLDRASPAFGTASYNAIRMRLERGETETPRKQLDAILGKSLDQPDSLVNGWRAERMRLATSFDDLLRWAPRKPVDVAYFVDSDDSPVLAQDALQVLNYNAPLPKLTLAAHSTQLPPWSASDIAVATWTRAVLLHDLEAVRAAADVVGKAHPDWAASLTPRSGQPEAAWMFHAALLIALHREFAPMIPMDYRKHRGWQSWWCPVEAWRPGDVAWRLPAAFTPAESVLTAEERDRAKAEVTELQQTGSAQAFLAPIIFAWAEAHPGDPLVPEALHRLVMVVRYGCRSRNEPAKQISKRAFDLLHTRYAKSEWTAKTPYWFD